jgi:hypothetical protein
LTADVERDLYYGWGNGDWVVRREFIEALLRRVWQAEGPILECGSGLSTLLVGRVAQRTGNRVWSLEHLPNWAEHVRRALRRYGITSVEVCLAPLRNYGSYTWYSAPREALPRDFALVICDGPPGTTPGGRYGLLPEMRAHLRSGCAILLDDAGRAGEQEVLERWSREAGCAFSTLGLAKPFAQVAVPDA